MTWVVEGKIPRGDVSTLDGDGGLGKTMAAMQLAMAVARGAPDWPGFIVAEQGPGVFLSADEPAAEIHRRAYRIAARGSFDLASAHDLPFWFPSDLGDCLMAAQTARGAIEPQPLFRSLAERRLPMRTALTVTAHVAAYLGGTENNT